MGDITDTGNFYWHGLVKRVCKDIEIKYSGEHHNLYVWSDRLLLAEVFIQFQNMCLEISVLGPFCTRINKSISLKNDQSQNDLPSFLKEWKLEKMRNLDFAKLLQNVSFVKAMEHRDIKLVTAEERRNYFVSQPNLYYKFHIKIIEQKLKIY